MLGASLSLVVSPCCTPFVAILSSVAFGVARTPLAALNIAAFALGHVLPLVAFGLGTASIRKRFETTVPARAVSAVNAGLMLGLAGYYALLA
jgi:cytochrome c biogenesis protein CcdA